MFIYRQMGYKYNEKRKEVPRFSSKYPSSRALALINGIVAPD
jgi:hypothetical protein